MSVFKRKTPTGETAFYHYAFMQGGKRYRGVCEGCTVQKDALAFEKKVKDKATEAVGARTIEQIDANRRAELVGKAPITLENAFSEYASKPKKRTPGEHQLSTNNAYWNDFLLFMRKEYPDVTTLDKVTQKHAENYLKLLRESGAFCKTISFERNGRVSNYQQGCCKLSNRTINARHKAIKAVFAWLAADAWLSSNPFDIPTLENKSAHREVLEKEMDLILSSAPMPFIKPIFMTGFYTGLTLGDICLLRWSNIIEVYDEKAQRNGLFITKNRLKTDVPLEIPVQPELESFLVEQYKISGDGEFVFPMLADLYQRNRSGVNYRIQKFLEEIGIKTSEKITGRSRAVSTKAAHAMRHTFAYIAGVKNIPITIVQAVLGHMSPEMTALYQRHSTRQKLQDSFRGFSLTQSPTTTKPMSLLGNGDARRDEVMKRLSALSTDELERLLELAKNN